MPVPVIVALVVIGVFGVLGYRDGVVKRVLEILGVFVTLVLTARFAAAVQPWIMDHTGLAEGPSLLVTWAGLFLAGLLLSRMIATSVSRLLRLTILGWLDKGGGALVGMALGTLVASVLLVAASQVPGARAVQTTCEGDALGRFIFYAAPNFYEQVRRLQGGRAEEVWRRVLHTARDTAGDSHRTLEDAVDRARSG